MNDGYLPNSAYPRVPFRLRLVLVVAFLTGCSASTTTVAPVAEPQLATASATKCLYPSTSAQTVALPSAAGVTGTISIGALPVTSSTCLGVTLATGADAVSGDTSSPGASTADARQRDEATPQPALPAPIASISLTNAYTGNLTWAAVTLNIPAGSVPAGSYPARIVSTLDLADGQQETSFKNFTVVVSASGAVAIVAPPGSNILAILAADTTGTLTIYPRGTVLPTPAPIPTETPTPIATATASASPSPSASPTATPIASPTPPPASSPTPTPAPFTPGFVTLPGVAVSLSPGSCINTGMSGGTYLYEASVSAPPPAGTSYIYAWSALALQPAFTVIVPPPTQNLQYGIGGGPKAQVVVPAFGDTGQTGESGAMVVQLYLQGTEVPYYGINVVLDENGNRVAKGSVIAAGSVTCASLGM
jgi:hypothetical protein